MGVGAHALDELHGRPLRTRIPDRTLWTLAVASVAAATAIGIYACVAWTWSLPNGPNESTPVVHDGVLFIESYGDKVQALDAATGELLWQYSRRLPSGVAPSIKRGISIYGTKLYVPTSDSHLVALDVKTGKVVWDQQIADVLTYIRSEWGNNAPEVKPEQVKAIRDKTAGRPGQWLADELLKVPEKE